jgi:hypothetical protein
VNQASAGQPRRRTVIAAVGLLPLASLAPSLIMESQARASAGSGYRFFDKHQGAVIRAAAARLVPGPSDDPTEALFNSPGATEADVVRYIDTMLSMFDDHPAKIFAGGPWSNRHGGDTDHMKHFVPPAPRQVVAWKERIKQLRTQYADAVRQLDAAVSSKDFATATTVEQDRALTKLNAVRDLIFTNTIEGMYSVPEYGGNANGVGWKSVSWPGDSQPNGYTAAEVERNDGEDVLVASDVVTKVLSVLPVAARHMVARGWPRG